MLTFSHRQVYENFVKVLVALSKAMTNPDISKTSWQGSFAQVQLTFEEEIIVLAVTELEGMELSRWQSLQTEIHRTMRLLQTEVMRWQTSRQEGTEQLRKDAVRDRVNQLIAYCQALLSL